MEDEGRLLDTEEARIRRRVAEKVRKEVPKISVEQVSANRFPLNEKRRFVVRKKVRGQPRAAVEVVSHNLPTKEMVAGKAPKTLHVGSIRPLPLEDNPMAVRKFSQLSSEFRNKIVSPKEIKEAATKISSILPNIDVIEGTRVTGAKVKNRFSDVKGTVRNLATTNLTQRIPLGGLRKAAEKAATKSKAGKIFTSALRATRAIQKAGR